MKRSWRAIAAGLTVAVGVPAAIAAAGDTQPATRNATTSKADQDGNYMVVIASANDKAGLPAEYHRTVDLLLKDRPEGSKVRFLLARVYDPSHDRIVTYAHSTVPLNPKGQEDGEEQFYRIWWGVDHTVTWRDGVKDGLEKLYERSNAPPGRTYVETEIPWVNGKMHGVRKVYYPDGRLRTRVSYDNGLAQGESMSYDPDGKPTRRAMLKDGKRHGETIDYWPATGKPKRVVPYSMGKVEGVAREYYENGQLKRELPFKDNAMHGVERQYEADGRPSKTRYWLDGRSVPEGVFREKFKP